MNFDLGNFGDVASGLTITGSIVGYLPEIAAAFAIIWTIMRMYDWIELRWKARKARKEL